MTWWWWWNGLKYCYVYLTIQLNCHLITQLNDQTFLFLTIQFIMNHFFCKLPKCPTVLFDLLIRPYQVLPLQVRVDLGVMTMKRYFIFSKTPRLETHNQIVSCHIQDTHWGKFLPLCRDAVSIFYSPSQVGSILFNINHLCVLSDLVTRIAI